MCGVSQRRLAEISEMSLNRVGIILRGETPPASVGEVDALSTALGLTVTEVLREAEAAEREGRAGLRVVDGEADRDGTATSEAEAEGLAPPLDAARREADGGVDLEGWAVAAHDPGTDPEAEAEAFGAL
jgi:hypothetical protein